jgi:hypothetical protein
MIDEQDESVAKALKVVDVLAPEQSKIIFDAYMNVKQECNITRLNNITLVNRVTTLEVKQNAITETIKHLANQL